MNDGDMDVTEGTASFAKATYGAAWNFWPFLNNETANSNLIGSQKPNNVILVGTFKGKGCIYRGNLTASSGELIYGTTATNIFTVNNDATGVVSVSGPTGGVGQFKGLT